MSDFAAGIPDEAREAMMKQPGGPFHAVFRGLVAIAIANLLIDLHAWLQLQFPGAPDYLLRLVVLFSFVGAVALLLWIGFKLFTLWESVAEWWGRARWQRQLTKQQRHGQSEGSAQRAPIATSLGSEEAMVVERKSNWEK